MGRCVLYGRKLGSSYAQRPRSLFFPSDATTSTNDRDRVVITGPPNRWGRNEVWAVTHVGCADDALVFASTSIAAWEKEKTRCAKIAALLPYFPKGLADESTCQ